MSSCWFKGWGSQCVFIRWKNILKCKTPSTKKKHVVWFKGPEKPLQLNGPCVKTFFSNALLGWASLNLILELELIWTRGPWRCPVEFLSFQTRDERFGDWWKSYCNYCKQYYDLWFVHMHYGFHVHEWKFKHLYKIVHYWYFAKFFVCLDVFNILIQLHF